MNFDYFKNSMYEAFCDMFLTVPMRQLPESTFQDFLQ